MDHAAAAGLEPALAAAAAAAFTAADAAGGVEFEARLGEGEVAGAHPDPAVGAEKRLHHVDERPLEVAHRETTVHGKPFHLHERGQVGGVDGVAAVAAAGRDHVDGRRLEALHRADLHR